MARGSFVGCTWQRGLVLVALVAGAISTASGQDVISLKVTILAREFSQGEPLRIVARSREELASLNASLRGQKLSMERISANAQGETWVGWAVIALLEEAGPVLLELRGVTKSGHQVDASRELQVVDKGYPTERLKVEPKYVEPPQAIADRIRREKARLAKIYELRTPQCYPCEPFLRPLRGGRTSPFGVRRVFNGKPRAPHSGLDLRAAQGSEVRASGPGYVVLAASLYYSGKLIILDHGGGLFTLYAHLSRFEVREGEMVTPGQIIGLSGTTGRVTGPHLHWGAKIGSQPFDPRALLDPVLFR